VFLAEETLSFQLLFGFFLKSSRYGEATPSNAIYFVKGEVGFPPNGVSVQFSRSKWGPQEDDGLRRNEFLSKMFFSSA